MMLGIIKQILLELQYLQQSQFLKKSKLQLKLLFLLLLQLNLLSQPQRQLLNLHRLQNPLHLLQNLIKLNNPPKIKKILFTLQSSLEEINQSRVDLNHLKNPELIKNGTHQFSNLTIESFHGITLNGESPFLQVPSLLDPKF